MEIKAYIDDNVGKELRMAAMKRFGYFKGSISNAVEEAVIQWLSRNKSIEERLQNILKKAEMDKRVIAILLFGSFAGGKTNYRDIDLAFLLSDKSDELSTLSEYEDFIENPKFDMSCLNSLAVGVKKEVLASGKILLCKDKSKLYDFMISTLKEWEDFKHVYELMVYGRNK